MNAARKRYSKFMMFLHWTTAALLIVACLSSEGAREVRAAPPTLHFAVGLAVLVLVLPRLVARALGGVPASEGVAGTWLTRSAEWGHAALYVLLVAVPVTGWYTASRLGVKVSILGLTLPGVSEILWARRISHSIGLVSSWPV